MVRESFNDDIKDLKKDVLFMIDKVENLIKTSMQALLYKDIDKARSIAKLDDEIDNCMYEIEEKAINLIALQQPMARDLRFIFSVTHMITDLERVGDFCVNIAREAIAIGDEDFIKPLIDIPKMRDIILDMIKDIKMSLELEDADIALSTGKKDKLVDEIYINMYNDILDMIHSNKKYTQQATRLLFIGRFLERIGDHLTNVCEMVIYISKGERVEIN
ncbi:phosphate signaling complex protein PhoU [Tepidibacter aestuarii]|uniref:phosphate signaling complex protein PhoU n=1 Tax=Tepidibacter aestuarii TaxID=2925782 RepID=UPI0020BF57F6|nr:phosphate signaling complex protein PhoU [Tepidibacter aestuarii]CAH2214475.1 Phosphate-specific transport system accessory protein PhoU [Tepidibacter aestuarii]